MDLTKQREKKQFMQYKRSQVICAQVSGDKNPDRRILEPVNGACDLGAARSQNLKSCRIKESIFELHTNCTPEGENARVFVLGRPKLNPH